YQQFNIDHNNRNNSFSSIIPLFMIVPGLFVFAIIGFVLILTSRHKSYRRDYGLRNWKHPSYYKGINETNDINSFSLKSRSKEIIEVKKSSTNIFCSECGTKMMSGDNFCLNCGTRVEG
ncbi:MAG: zinc-ribbon domain-containing protein, partial [Candidatus Hodarchaeales archaeon]